MAAILFWRQCINPAEKTAVNKSTKTKDRQFDNFLITGVTLSNENKRMTTYGATSDDEVIKLTIFCFQ